MKLSICVVNYNSGKLIEACLDSIVRYPPSYPYEVIVIDNNSLDGSQVAVKAYLHTSLIQNTDNLGFAKASNQAFHIATGEYLLILNADTEIKPNALDQLLACGDANPQAGLISAHLVNSNGTTQVGFNVRKFPDLKTAIVQLSLLDELWPNNPLTNSYMCLEFDYTRLQSVDQPAASALLYRRATLNEVGGFDERFVNWFNDVDLCKRVQDSGWKILFCPSAKIMHHGGMGGSSRHMTDIVCENYRSQRLYYFKHFGSNGYKIVSACVIVGMILRLLVLNIAPKLSKHVHTQAVRNCSNSTRHAFRAVLQDTLRSWESLPIQFLHTDKG